MKKQTLILSFLLILSNCVFAQYSGSFVVQGDLGKYYPVIFTDASWYDNKTTDFNIGRSNVHADAMWRGSLIAKFRVHTTSWGNGSNFIEADIHQSDAVSSSTFIAGWEDGSISSNNKVIIVWLQGGGNTYYFSSPANVNPAVYDNVQNALPYQIVNGANVTYKTDIDSYVNSYGENGETAYYTGNSDNYFAGNLGIGTTTPDATLAVNGNIHSKEVKVDLTGWADYVFKPEYQLPSLSLVKEYIDQYHHLPEIPSEQEIAKDGLNLGEMNRTLVKKVEELTLYLVEQHVRIADQERHEHADKALLQTQQNQINGLKEQLNLLAKKLNKINQ